MSLMAAAAATRYRAERMSSRNAIIVAASTANAVAYISRSSLSVMLAPMAAEFGWAHHEIKGHLLSAFFYGPGRFCFPFLVVFLFLRQRSEEKQMLEGIARDVVGKVQRARAGEEEQTSSKAGRAVRQSDTEERSERSRLENQTRKRWEVGRRVTVAVRGLQATSA